MLNAGNTTASGRVSVRRISTCTRRKSGDGERDGGGRGGRILLDGQSTIYGREIWMEHGRKDEGKGDKKTSNGMDRCTRLPAHQCYLHSDSDSNADLCPPPGAHLRPEPQADGSSASAIQERSSPSPHTYILFLPSSHGQPTNANSCYRAYAGGGGGAPFLSFLPKPSIGAVRLSFLVALRQLCPEPPSALVGLTTTGVSPTPPPPVPPKLSAPAARGGGGGAVSA